MGSGVAAGAAALPGKWVKPVVDKVLVPAHAQTSTTTTTTTAAPTTTTTTTTSTTTTTTTIEPLAFRGTIQFDRTDVKMSKTDGILEKFAAKILPIAHAVSAIQGDLCITSPDQVNFEAKLLVQWDGDHYFEGSGSVAGGFVTFEQTATPCGFNPQNLQIEVSVIAAGGATFAIAGWLLNSGILPVGTGCPSKPPGCIDT